MRLTELRQRMTALRKALGRKGWRYQSYPGRSMQIERDSPHYNGSLSFRDNCHINPPRMEITHANGGDIMVKVEVSESFGDYTVTLPGGQVMKPTHDIEVVVTMIKGAFVEAFAKAKRQREDRDFYPTPLWCIYGLFDLLTVTPFDHLLEPAKGDGRIIEAFNKTVAWPGQAEVKWAELDQGRDYLNPDGLDLSAELIVTNPPFSLALEFIKTALERDLAKGGTCAMLLRMSMLGAKERADFWRKYPPTHMVVMTPRPSFVGGGSDNSEYAWFIWDYGKRLGSLPKVWPIKKDEIIEKYPEAA